MVETQQPNRPERHRGYDVEYLDPGSNFRPKWGVRSEALRQSVACKLDIAYGYGQRGHLDFFPAANASQAPTLIFLHGGYWQKGDKAFYSYVAEPYLKQGVSCITLNYDFCPSVRITEIVAQIRAAVTWVWHNAATLGLARDQLHISGHSAGAHLSAMMMATDWPAHDVEMPADVLKSAALISGIYDLAPLLQEPANSQLQLDDAEVGLQSPTLLRSMTDAPQLVAYGEQESDAFHQQSQAYADSRHLGAGKLSCVAIPGRHHFDIMDAYADGQSDLFAQALALIKS